MAPKHSRERHELVAARELLKLEVGRIRKRLVRGSATARDEWWFNFITGRDASTVSRENQFQRRYRLAKESLRRLITKEEASTVERHWYHKLSCGEDVESVMSEMAKARLACSSSRWVTVIRGCDILHARTFLPRQKHPLGADTKRTNRGYTFRHHIYSLTNMQLHGHMELD